jgi:hypothetical protein
MKRNVPNTNPDRHANTWEDGGVYLCEVSQNYHNPIHNIIVEAKVVGPTGWCSKTGRPHGEVDITVMSPAYELDMKWSRANPSAIYFLRIIKKLDFTFDGAMSDWYGKTPRSVL